MPATDVAEWAGNSVEVLHRIYATCITGHDRLHKDRIHAADTAEI